ncbi:MAG: helix-turn-helix transcriptional regulator [Rhodospirillaceae bacterium]
MNQSVRGKGENTNEVDVLVGQRLRELRMLAGLSQGDLAGSIGLTFQQLQKYEKGVNRISASKLYMLSQHLNVSISALFSELDPQLSGDSDSAGTTADTIYYPSNKAGIAQPKSREALVLVRHYMRIADPATRQALKAFIDACADSYQTAGGESGSGDSFESSTELDDTDDGRRSRRPRGATWHPSDIGRG